MRHQDPLPDIDPEKLVVIRKIRRLMEFWRIQPHELRGRPVASPGNAAVVGIRYRHPVSGLSWDGRGSQPEWLRLALLREGYTVEELRRHAQVAAPQPEEAAQRVAAEERHCAAK